MDIVSITELQVATQIGVFDWEQRIRQNLILDLELATDVGKAAASDDIGDAINYASVAERVGEILGERPYQLLETVAETVAQMLLKEFPTRWVRVSVRKPRILRNAREVGIRIERSAS